MPPAGLAAPRASLPTPLGPVGALEDLLVLDRAWLDVALLDLV